MKRARGSAKIAAAGLAALGMAGCMGRVYTDREIAERFGHVYGPFLATCTADVNGITTRYADLGAGEAVVLLHGFPETLQGWRDTAPALAEHFRVLVPDLVGAGETGKPAIRYSPQEMAAFVKDFLDAAGVERAHVVGTDTGLVVAAAFAGQYPERTGRVVLAAGTVHPEDITSWEIRMMCTPVLGKLAMHNPFVNLVVKRSLRKGFTNPRLVSREMYVECVRSIRARGGRRAALRMIRAFTRDAPFMDACLKLIRSPVLVVYADRDCYFPLRAGERLASELGAELRVIPDCGHFLQEEKPEAFNARLLEFLRPERGGGE